MHYFNQFNWTPCKESLPEKKIIGRLYNAELKEATVQNTAFSVYDKEYITKQTIKMIYINGIGEETAYGLKVL